MQAEITYIFHNCFVIKLKEKAFLFDYPADEYLNEAMHNTIVSRITDTDLYIFSSHKHPDHFNPNVARLSPHSKNITYLLSSDIVKKNRQFKEMAECYPISPDQDERVNGLGIRTFLSNDQGVAFLISFEDLNIYFGGDLANWNWDNLSTQERRLLVDYFGEVLTKLQKWPIHIAFSNTDQRLKNWAGAAQFIETIKPRLFVPMHTFGETQSIAKFITEHPNLPAPIFKYQKTGDSMFLDSPVQGGSF
jgi:L-ascorbate metabolism protein UlaG (beta-lactamase superfamily)